MGLPNLDSRQPIVDGAGLPTLPFHIWWQEFVKSQNSVNTELLAQLALLTGVDSSVSSILAAAEEGIIVTSGTLACSITATDLGANARISVSAHTRVYGNGDSVVVSGGTISGLAYNTEYFIYYDQGSREGGEVPYLATTTKSVATQVNGRHLVGKVTTPTAAAPDTTGVAIEPPGFSNLP